MNQIKVGYKYNDYLFRKANKYKIPLSGAFEITPLCNMSCKMCYSKLTKEERDLKGRERSLEEWLYIAEQAKKEGTLFLLLTGGEPFLKKDFKELYISLYNMGFIISINSNATLIGEEDVEWLSKYPPMCVNVTLYGGCNETYNNLCNNPKGFDQATKGIQLLKNAGIQVKINASITPYNVNDLEDIIFYANTNNLHIQATTYMFPPIRKDKNLIGKNDRFTSEEAGKILAKINYIKMGEEKFNIYKDKLKQRISQENDGECLYTEGKNMQCRAGVSTYWITWDGKMLACGMMDNIKSYPFEEGFKESWAKIVTSTKNVRLPIECANCNNKNICSMCAAKSVTETGESTSVPTYMCEMTREYIEEVKNM